MPNPLFASYRWRLLASVFGVAFSGAAYAQTAYTNSTSVTDSGAAPPPYTLLTGDSLNNTSAGTITVNNHGIGAVIVTGMPASFINNAGLINFHGSSGGAAINVVSSGSVGTITNSGTVTSAGVSGGTPDGILVAGKAGTLSNTGLITSSSGNGINVQGGSITSIVNQGVISSTASGGSGIANSGTIGSILNSGMVIANSGTAILNSGSIGTITNAGSGLISGLTAIANTGTTGSIANAGTVIANSGTAIMNSGFIGTITNSGSGLISGRTAIANTGTTGSIFNAATVIANSGAAILNSGSIGTINNTGSGLISGLTAITNTGTTGSITNSGTVIANSGTAILNSGSIGTITNAGSGLISGLTAIDNTAGAKLTINNAGTIIGPIKLGTNADTLNITGGSIGGAIVGQTGSGDTINFNTTGTFTTGGSIANVDTLSVNSGDVVVANPITGAALFAIQQGAAASLSAPVTTTTFNNSGLLNVGSTAATINGNYNQTSTGQLGLTVTGSGSGSLNVTGTATVAGHANAIEVNVATNNNIFGQRYNFISAGSLVISNIGSLTVSANNPLVAFDVSLVGNQLVLNALLPTPTQAMSAANDLVFGTGLSDAKSNGLSGIGYTNAVKIGNALNGLLTYNIVRGNDSLYNLLNGFTATQWNQVFTQLVPTFVGRAEHLLTTSLVGSGPWLGAVEHRLSITRGPDGQVSGLAAGDDPAPGISAWIQPYGAFASQDQQSGVSGYNATIYGVALGADTAVRPDVRVGLAIEFGSTDVRYTDFQQGDSDSIFTAQLTGYGTWHFADNFFLDGQLSYAHSSFNTTNYITPLSAQLKASYGGNTVMGRIGLGYVWKSDKLTVTPLVSLQQYLIGIDSYTTTGGEAANINEHIGSQTINITQPRIGSSVSYRFADLDGYTAIPEMHLYYMHNFGDDHSTVNGSFVTSGSGFQVTSPTFGKDVVNIGAGVTVMQKGPWNVTASYDHTDSGTARQDMFYVRVRTQF